jgi:mannose-1-phosphate guanylyltransferase
VIGVSDIVVVAEPDAVLVCHREDSQAVKILVDGLKPRVVRSARARALHQAEPRPWSRPTASTSSCAAFRPARPSPCPISTVQLLEGVLEMDGDVYAAGALIPLDDAVSARAIGAATLLVTKPR